MTIEQKLSKLRQAYREAKTDLDKQIIHKRALFLKYSQNNKKNDNNDDFIKGVIKELF